MKEFVRGDRCIELPDIYLKRQDGSQVLVEEMDIRPESAFIKTATGEAIFLEGPVILTDFRMTFEGDDNSVIMEEQINTKLERLEPIRFNLSGANISGVNHEDEDEVKL